MYVAKYHHNSELRTIWGDIKSTGSGCLRGLSVLPLSQSPVGLHIEKGTLLVSKDPHGISDYFEDPHNISEGEVDLFYAVEGDEAPFLLCIYEWLLRINNTQK